MVLQAFPGHKGPVSCLAFRQGTSELFSGSFDRSVKIWNVEDRAYINTLFGHQSEVLSVDCLRKERVLTVGRDRTAHLFKVTTGLWSKGFFFLILKFYSFFLFWLLRIRFYQFIHLPILSISMTMRIFSESITIVSNV